MTATPKDRALEMFAEVREEAMKMREITHRPGALSPGLKCAITAALFTAIRCVPCYKAYVLLARELQVSRDEFLEVFSLVINAQGCVGDVWAARAVEFYNDLEKGKIKPEDVLDELCDTLNPGRISELIDSLR